MLDKPAIDEQHPTIRNSNQPTSQVIEHLKPHNRPNRHNSFKISHRDRYRRLSNAPFQFSKLERHW